MVFLCLSHNNNKMVSLFYVYALHFHRYYRLFDLKLCSHINNANIVEKNPAKVTNDILSKMDISACNN